MTKEELLNLINELPNDAFIALRQLTHDGEPSFKNIEKIEYDEYNRVYIVK